MASSSTNIHSTGLEYRPASSLASSFFGDGLSGAAASSSDLPRLTDGEFSALFKDSVWDYSIEEIDNLENSLKHIRRTEGKGSERYSLLKKTVHEVRLARLPLRAYEVWKSFPQEASQFNTSYFLGSDPRSKYDRSIIKAKLIDAAYTPGLEDRLNLLSRLTFIHGSSSAALALMLQLPEPTLQCTGALLAQGIAPMSGELSIGSGRFGINQYLGLSTETVRDHAKIFPYTKMEPFNPLQLKFLENPYCLLTMSQDHLAELILVLNRWKLESPEEYAAKVSPSSSLFNNLIDGAQFQIDLLNASIQRQQRELSENPSNKLAKKKAAQDKSFLQSLQRFVEELKKGGQLTSLTSSTISDQRYLSLICSFNDPMELLSGEEYWNLRTIQLDQMKQWDHERFLHEVSPLRDRWLASIELERTKEERPLHQLLAVLEHSFTEEESRYIEHYQTEIGSSLVEMPASLLPIFSTPSQIPIPPLRSVPFQTASADSLVIGCRQGQYDWQSLIHHVLKAKCNGTDLNHFKPCLEKELIRIERSYIQLTSALSDAPARIPLSPDEKARSLITDPAPIIFASTSVKARPWHQNEHYPREYILQDPVKLGKGGCDILFTDTEESRERILAILPDHLSKEIEIHLFNELDAAEVPLIHAPDQIDRTPFEMGSH